MLKYFVYLFALCATNVVALDNQQYPIVQHEGTPTGEVKVINDVSIYHAYPTGKSNDLAIVLFTDIFGYALPQTRLIADSFARGGYLVLIPDYFRGDPIPQNMTGFDMNAWFARHPTTSTQPIVDSTIKYARDTLKVRKLGVVGYCWGGPLVVRQLAAGTGVDAGFTAHPGAFTNAEALAIAAPLSLAAADTDFSLSASRRREVEDLLLKNKARYQIALYSGGSHGFAVSIDLNDRKQVFAKESAFYPSIPLVRRVFERSKPI